MKKDMLGTAVRKIVDLPLEMIGAICDLVEKLLGEAGQKWLAELKKFLRKENCWTGIVVETFLKCISTNESLILDAVDGTEVLADAKDVFNGGIDSDFKNWDADEPGQPTAETAVEVYEMEKDATFSQMFGELNADTRKLCLSQSQIKNFVKKYRRRLRMGGYATFFLFESNGNFFVADVSVYSDGSRSVRVAQFEHSDVWDAGARRRLVVPKLA